jgi:hypothetical protein
MARPGTFTSPFPESRMSTLQVRIEPSLLERLKEIPNWADLIRDHAAELVEKEGRGIPEHLKGVVY